MLAWVKDETYPSIHLMDGETTLLTVRPWEEGDDRPSHRVRIEGTRYYYPKETDIERVKDCAMVMLADLYQRRINEIRRARKGEY